MRILVATTTAIYKDYCWDDFRDQLKSFDYYDYDTLVVDNSPKEDYSKKIRRDGINCVWLDKRDSYPPQMLADSQNVIRQHFLNNNYDYLLILESDVFVPKWLLTYLASQRRTIHNITYPVKTDNWKMCLQTGIHLKNEYQTKMAEALNGFEMFTGGVEEFSRVGIGYDEAVSQTGTGCTFIMRDVMKKVKFRADKEHDKKVGAQTFPDSFFHFDAKMQGIPNYLDMNIIAKHVPSYGIG